MINFSITKIAVEWATLETAIYAFHTDFKILKMLL